MTETAPEQQKEEGKEAISFCRPLVRVVDAFAWLGVAALLVPTLLICADIVWRRAIGGAFMDTFDITQLCLVAAASWSIPYGFVHGNHVSVDLLVERFSASTQCIAEVVTYGITAILFVLLGWLAWQSAELHLGYHDTTQNLGLPVIYYWLVFLSGLTLTVLACLWRAGKAMTKKSYKRDA